MTTRYKTINTPAQGLYKEKGSRFIAYAFPVFSLESIQIHLQELRKEHHAARHCCYAYRLGFAGELFRANDDGEPSGTAGKPILGVLLSAELTNIFIAVVRYFGGIKLGVAGLIEAYRTASEDALAQCQLIWREVMVHIRLLFYYDAMHAVYATLKRYNGTVLSEKWTEGCEMIASFSKEMSSEAIQELQNLPRFEILGEY